MTLQLDQPGRLAEFSAIVESGGRHGSMNEFVASLDLSVDEESTVMDSLKILPALGSPSSVLAVQPPKLMTLDFWT